MRIHHVLFLLLGASLATAYLFASMAGIRLMTVPKGGDPFLLEVVFNFAILLPFGLLAGIFYWANKYYQEKQALKTLVLQFGLQSHILAEVARLAENLREAEVSDRAGISMDDMIERSMTARHHFEDFAALANNSGLLDHRVELPSNNQKDAGTEQPRDSAPATS